MDKSPAGPIIAALEERIRNDTAIKSLMGGTARFYKRVPENRSFPYIVLDSLDVDFEDEDDCSSGAESTGQLSIYSRQPDTTELTDLASALVEALRPDLVLDGHNVIDQAVKSARFRDDQDGLSRRAILPVWLDTEPR